MPQPRHVVPAVKLLRTCGSQAPVRQPDAKLLDSRLAMLGANDAVVRPSGHHPKKSRHSTGVRHKICTQDVLAESTQSRGARAALLASKLTGRTVLA